MLLTLIYMQPLSFHRYISIQNQELFLIYLAYQVSTTKYNMIESIIKKTKTIANLK